MLLDAKWNIDYWRLALRCTGLRVKVLAELIGEAETVLIPRMKRPAMAVTEP
jgi:hypothetical protein